jgi:WhiB family redox-sensing transcriptional regulator
MSAATETFWRQQAACAPEDPDLFFSETQRDIKKAKAICRACPVIRKCLEEALASEQRHGTWGGLSEAEREGLRRAAGRASWNS